MVHEEQARGGWVAGVAQPPSMWPPEEGGSYRPGSHDFMAKCARSGGRAVEWPPRGDEVYGSSPALNCYGQQQVAPPVPPRPKQYPLQAHSSAPNLLEEEAAQPKTFQRQPPPSISSSPFARKSAAIAPLPRMDTSSSQQSGSEGNLTTVYPSNFKLRSEMPVQQEPAKVFSSQPAFKSTKPIRMRGDCKWPPSQGSSEDTSQEQVREFIKPRKQCKDYSSFFAQHALPSSYTGYRAPPGTQHVGVSDEDAVDM